MHNGDRDGFPKRTGLVNCGHWMMPMLWNGGRADKISNKLAGDVTCLGGSVVEHQPRLLGSRVRFSAGRLRFFPFLPKLHFQFPFPFLFLSLSLSLRPFVCAKKTHLRIHPINDPFINVLSCELQQGHVSSGPGEMWRKVIFKQNFKGKGKKEGIEREWKERLENKS